MRQRLEEIMLRVSQSGLIDAGKQAEAIRLVLESVCEGLSITRAGVWFLDHELDAIRCDLLIDRANNTESENIVLSERDYPRYFAGLYSERAIVADDARSDPATSEFRDGYLVPLGVTSMMDVPIRHHGKMIGIICAEHTGPMRQWTGDEVTFAGAMGDLVGRAINARISHEAHEALAALNRELEQRVERRGTELKAAQAQLVEAEKMAALGALVAGIAHEVNTPLGVAVTAVSLLQEGRIDLQRRFDLGELDETVFLIWMDELGRTLSLLEDNLQRAATLVKNFKQTAVDQTSDQRQEFDLHALVKRTLASVHPLTREICDPIVVKIASDFHMDSFPGALSQILTNLLMNCVRHAFPEPKAGDRIEVLVETASRPPWVCISVADNGVGIPAGNIARIFEPFFTTRRGQGGSGLGLAICYNLATQRLGGRLKVESVFGQGSRFTLEIPIVAPPTNA
jgi:two-component system, NtrC family, sensor kinase